jgi:hypothetical protein
MQILEKMREERIVDLIAEKRAEAKEITVNSGLKPAEKVENRDSEEPIVPVPAVEFRDPAVQPTNTSTKLDSIVDVDSVLSAIGQFPKGLVQDYIHAALTEFNAMLIGAPGTGKRTLISAICDVEIKRLSILADASIDESKPYTIEHSYKTENKETKCKVNFWSTKGIENWSDSNIHQYVDKIKAKKNLMCMIYCVTPNSFASRHQIEYILAECVRARIFSVLVVTNMYVGPAANQVLDMLKTMLAHHIDITREEDGISYYGHVGLCTKVNSAVFTTQKGTEYPVKGIDELTVAISQSLSREKAIGWGFLLVENGPFWLRKHAKMFGLLDAIKSYLPSWW